MGVYLELLLRNYILPRTGGRGEWESDAWNSWEWSHFGFASDLVRPLSLVSSDTPWDLAWAISSFSSSCGGRVAKAFFLLKVNSSVVWLKLYLRSSVKWGRVQTSQFSPHLNQTCFCSTPWLKDLLKTVKTKLILIYLREDLKDTLGSRAESVRESNENQRASQLPVMGSPDSRAGNCTVMLWQEIGVGVLLSPRNSCTARVWNPCGNLSRGLAPMFTIY